MSLGAGARWYVKKAARRGVAMASFATGSLLVRALAASMPRLRAITYHRSGDVPADPYCVLAATDRLFADAGHQIAFNSLHGTIRPRMRQISLPRVKIEAGEGLTMFALACRGAMDAWRVVDDLLWCVQQNRAETRA